MVVLLVLATAAFPIVFVFAFEEADLFGFLRIGFEEAGFLLLPVDGVALAADERRDFDGAPAAARVRAGAAVPGRVRLTTRFWGACFLGISPARDFGSDALAPVAVKASAAGFFAVLGRFFFLFLLASLRLVAAVLLLAAGPASSSSGLAGASAEVSVDSSML